MKYVNVNLMSAIEMVHVSEAYNSTERTRAWYMRVLVDNDNRCVGRVGSVGNQNQNNDRDLELEVIIAIVTTDVLDAGL